MYYLWVLKAMSVSLMEISALLNDIRCVAAHQVAAETKGVT